MSKYTIILCTLSLLWLFLGIKTLISNPAKKSHLLLAVLCLTMIVWTFFLGAAYSLDSIDKVTLFLKFAYIGGFLFSPVNLHFYLAVTNTPVRLYHLALIYTPYFVLAVSNFISSFVFAEYTRFNNEWTGILNTGNIIFRLYFIIVILTFVISLAVILKWHKKTNQNKERIQSRLILVLFTSTYFTSLLLTMIFPFFGINRLQHIGIILFSMYIIGLYFLVVRIRFMNIDKAASADEIFSNINELVFMLNNELIITDANSAVLTELGVSISRVKNRPFTDMVTEKNAFTSMAGDIADGKIKNFRMIIHYTPAEEKYPARVYVSGIRDRFDDISGYLVILDHVKEIEQFKKTYRITPRELEIVSMTVSGSTYKDIAEKLQISERTVERHLTNIYNKLGINNKIELFRIAEEFNLKV